MSVMAMFRQLQPGVMHLCLSRKKSWGEYEERDDEYSQGNHVQWVVVASPATDFARSALCSCHVVLSRGKNRVEGTACAERSATSIDWSLKKCRKRIGC
jgi:hypothetical protein